MLSINSSTHLLPRVEAPDSGSSAKLFGQRRRSSALDMSLMTVYVRENARSVTCNSDNMQ